MNYFFIYNHLIYFKIHLTIFYDNLYYQLKEYMDQNSSVSKVSDKEIELLFTYLDRKEFGRITLDEFVNEMMVY